MANTYTQIYLHFVFAVKNRASLIHPSWKIELFKFITGIVQNNNHKLIAINGIPNHVHLLIGYKPHPLIPELLQDIKGDSSKWINKNKFTKDHFSWQAEYGAFSYSHSQVNVAAKYIMNQEEHHKTKSFKEKYFESLKQFNISFDKYVLKVIN